MSCVWTRELRSMTLNPSCTSASSDLCERRILVVMLVDCPLREITPTVDTDRPDGSGYDEIWLADCTLVEAYGGVDIFPLSQPTLERPLDLRSGFELEHRRVVQPEIGNGAGVRILGLGRGRERARGIGGREARQRHRPAREIDQRLVAHVGAGHESDRLADADAEAEAAGSALLQRLDHAAAHRDLECPRAVDTGFGVRRAGLERELDRARRDALELGRRAAVDQRRRVGARGLAPGSVVAHVAVPPTVISVKRTVG